jgi:hypothetical protein
MPGVAAAAADYDQRTAIALVFPDGDEAGVSHAPRYQAILGSALRVFPVS